MSDTWLKRCFRNNIHYICITQPSVGWKSFAETGSGFKSGLKCQDLTSPRTGQFKSGQTKQALHSMQSFSITLETKLGPRQLQMAHLKFGFHTWTPTDVK